MMPLPYLIYFVAFGLLIMGYYKREYTFGAIGAMTLIVLGVYVATNGLTNVDNFLTQSLALVSICVGAYVLIRGGIESLYSQTA